MKKNDNNILTKFPSKKVFLEFLKPKWKKLPKSIKITVLILTALAFAFGTVLKLFNENVALINNYFALKPDFDIELKVFNVKNNTCNLINENEAYFSGDTLQVEWMAQRNCWIILFAVDNKGIYPVSNDFGLNPVYIDNDKPYKEKVYLDSTTGKDIFYLLATTQKKQLNNIINQVAHNIKVENAKTTTKGLLKSNYRLNLPGNIKQRLVCVNHYNNK
jgi:hypothetical protein